MVAGIMRAPVLLLSLFVIADGPRHSWSLLSWVIADITHGRSHWKWPLASCGFRYSKYKLTSQQFRQKKANIHYLRFGLPTPRASIILLVGTFLPFWKHFAEIVVRGIVELILSESSYDVTNFILTNRRRVGRKKFLRLKPVINIIFRILV